MENETTPFSVVYNSFLSKITDDMYMELTEAETESMLEELLLSAIPYFEFPKKNIFDYEVETTITTEEETSNEDDDNNNSDSTNTEESDIEALDGEEEDTSDIEEDNTSTDTSDTSDTTTTTIPAHFNVALDNEEINILATYMIVAWLGQQLASVENVRMKYSGSDFKFTSQANHMAKIKNLVEHYTTQGFHLQRLYKRRSIKDGRVVSTFDLLCSEDD